LTTIEEWRAFLQQWSDEWLETDTKFPTAVRKRRWLGYDPATEDQIERVETRLGYRLPPSYRAFLLTSNGWRLTSPMVKRLRPVSAIRWLLEEEPGRFELELPTEDEAPLQGPTAEEYYSYTQEFSVFADPQHFRKLLTIADPIEGDSLIYVLNPEAVTEDGEWEAWEDAHWNPGSVRYPSFAHLMRNEYEMFLAVVRGRAEHGNRVFGPFDDVYAPSRPRKPATRIGTAKPLKKRLTADELVAQLESPSARVRNAAAKHLVRQWPSNEKPQLVESLTCVLTSHLGQIARSAAALALGSYGDERATIPLIEALSDSDIVVANSALGGLSTLAARRRDPRIADAAVRLLATTQDRFAIENAMNILEHEFADSRLRPIALQLLDADIDGQLRYQAAFAYAKFAQDPLNELCARLTHRNHGIRAAAVAALRERNDPRATPHLAPLLHDPNPEVVMQATTTLRFLDQSKKHEPLE
jgi:HEAT repeat protein